MIEELKEEVIAHAIEVHPNECCGLAVIINGKLKYKRCRNIASGGQFAIDPEDYSSIEDQGEIVGICHSHVYEAVNPSDADRIGIEKSKLPWLIVNPDTKDYSITYPSGFKLDLIGRKFQHGVIDCLSLIIDYYKEIGIALPDMYREDNWWLKGADMYRDNFKSFGFEQVGGSEFTDFKKHDVILMQVGSPVPNHGAIYIGDGFILQHCQGRLSSKDVYSGYWRKVTNIVLRHKELM